MKYATFGGFEILLLIWAAKGSERLTIRPIQQVSETNCQNASTSPLWAWKCNPQDCGTAEYDVPRR